MPPQPLELEFKTKAVDDLLRACTRVENAFKRMNGSGAGKGLADASGKLLAASRAIQSAAAQINHASQRLGTATQRRASARGGGEEGARPRTSRFPVGPTPQRAGAEKKRKAADGGKVQAEPKAPAPRFPVGPNQRLIALQEALRCAQAANNIPAIADIQPMIRRTEERIRRSQAHPGDLTQRIRRSPVRPGDTTQRIRRSRSQPADATQRITSGSSRTRGGGRGTRGGGTRLPMGPNQRLPMLQSALRRAQAAGNSPAVADIQAMIKRTQGAIRRQQPSSRQAKLMYALSSSRFGLQNGKLQLMPLVGRTAAALGPEVAAVAAAAVAVVAAGVMFVKAMESAAEGAQQFARASMALGSGGRTTSAIGQIGAATGMSGEAMAGAASSIQGKITSDPMARAFAAQMGVVNLPGPFGNQDWGGQMMRILEGLRKITDPEERVRAARALGAESLLPATLMSNKQFAKIGPNSRDAALQASIFSPQFQQDSADFLSAIGRVGEALQNLLASLGKPIMSELTDWANDLADVINAIAEFFNRNQAALKAAFDMMKALVGVSIGNPGAALNGMKDAWDDLTNPGANGRLDPQGAQADELRKNTEALRLNTRYLQANGQFGRGERLGGAIPSGIGGEALRRGLQAGGFALPGF